MKLHEFKLHEYPTKLDTEDKLASILRYVGQSYKSSDKSGIMTLDILLDVYNKDKNFENFSVILKSLDDITEEDVMEVYKLASGSRASIIDMHFSVIKILSNSDVYEHIEAAKEYKKDIKIDIGDRQFHVRSKTYGNFDFWHGHKKLKELHFGFETENPSSYAEYSPMNPHIILQYLEKRGYMIPYNGVDLFDDGIAIKIKK